MRIEAELIGRSPRRGRVYILRALPDDRPERGDFVFACVAIERRVLEFKGLQTFLPDDARARHETVTALERWAAARGFDAACWEHHGRAGFRHVWHIIADPSDITFGSVQQ